MSERGSERRRRGETVLVRGFASLQLEVVCLVGRGPGEPGPIQIKVSGVPQLG